MSISFIVISGVVKAVDDGKRVLPRADPGAERGRHFAENRSHDDDAAGSSAVLLHIHTGADGHDCVLHGPDCVSRQLRARTVDCGWVIVLIPIGQFTLIKSPIRTFIAYHILIIGGMLVTALCAFLYTVGSLDGLYLMVISGIGLFCAYVPFVV
jgi:hypothetical protein